MGVHHLDMVVTSLERSLAFYRPLLEPLGSTRIGEIVDERAAWLRDRGATLESEPREYEYSPGYYAVFFFDPDGLKLEVVHVPAERG